ncbi:MAG TPA: adenylate/guanylate cyclase domain-containing protein, partial [Gaiellaceae bacterium]|nr:adenylate/guanylate cyclase domain-containing protein [Gaiellaceae bacterium]
MADVVTCASCGSENEAGRKFCGECGKALAQACPTCGTANPPTVKFCGECGTALTAAARVAAPEPASTPAAERRLVSVLFADLVGFTTLSESRDPEEVRELLSRYFDTCRRLIELYGGTVEKFIGDAVMAVWGTPTATEDDAERAVRAGLDLVAAVSALGDEVGAPELAARAGVLTGEAAVTLGAEGQGMVAGDLVNTSARIQSAAEPGTVFVGEATKRASEASIAYASAGSHELKGKDRPVPLWRALRVTAGRGGALKSAGLEPPFVGRDRELRLVKELFHATADEQRAHLVSVIGIAGIGKSRLGWEFFKYMDGLEEVVWWHRGRCLAYGEGVAFWALAEMIRMRAGIVEGEDPVSAREKVHVSLDAFLVDAEEHQFVEPRLLHLLGLEDGPARAKEELFGAWRLFFERMAEQGPVALLFEDLQWADSALVEFVGHLLEWSRNRPIFVLCLARPDLQSRHPEFGQGSHQTTLSLAPLSETAMQELLDGFVPGLPSDLRQRILDRSEGVPLYAVETVRMLLDRGLLTEQDGVYRLTGEVAELDVPETLHGLIAARLDGLSTEERRILQDGSVLGKTFTKESLAELSALPEAELDPLLGGLVRKEVLGVQADPRSPERGQYGFLQDLVRRVAYETLARRDRKSRHLAAAAQLERSFGAAEQEVVEVVAAHYLAAYEAQTDADDALEIKARARELLARAAERAASLGALGEARRSYEQAAELSDEPVERALLLEMASVKALGNAETEAAEQALRTALELLTQAGELHAAARVSGRLGNLEVLTGRGEGMRRMEEAFEAVAADEPDADVADLAARLGRGLALAGELERAVAPNELALEVAQALRLPETLVRALGTKAYLSRAAGRPEEELALARHALRCALENDLAEQAASGYSNLSDSCFAGDRYGEALDALGEALALARRTGERASELFALSEMTYALTMTGRWDEVVATFDELPEEQLRSNSNFASVLSGILEVFLHRGQIERSLELHAWFDYIPSEDRQGHAIRTAAQAALLHAQGRLGEAVDAGEYAAGISDVPQAVKQGLVWALESALALGEFGRADELLKAVEEKPPGLRPPFLDAQAQRFRARMSGDIEGFKAAAAGFREYGIPFWLAVTLLEHGELTGDQAPLGEAREIFE